MKSKKVPFVKGHMGGNEIVLVREGDFPREDELGLGLELLSPPGIRGDQLGLLSEGAGENDLVARIIDRPSSGYIPACGGLTQVLGLACRELDLEEALGVGCDGEAGRITLRTDLGPFRIRIGRGVEGEIETDMTPFLEAFYPDGLERGTVHGVESYRVGYFFVTFAEAIRKRHPDTNFDPLDEATRALLQDLQAGFGEEFALDRPNRDFAIVGPARVPEYDGELLFPHDLSRDLIEPACGSGTVAASVAMVDSGRTGGRGELVLKFAAGGDELSLGGPEVTRVELNIGPDGLISSIRFSHSLVELLATGRLYL